MSVEQFVEGRGTVTIGEGDKQIVLHIEPLSIEETERLWSGLADIGRRVGAGFHYRKMKSLLDVMDAADRAVAVKDIVEKETAFENVVNRALESNEGVAFELFTRSSKQHKESTLKHVQALVNDANREEVHLRLRQITATGTPGNA